MITPILEQWILKGKASYKVFVHSMGMFGRIQAPEDQVSIITQIVWQPFINWPTDGDISTTTYNQLFGSCEYQLKIDGVISNTTYVFRNFLNIFKSGNAAIDLDSTITAAGLKSILIQPGAPIVLDCYIPCGNEIKITISRNSYINGFTNSMGVVTSEATENISPNGVGDSSVLLYQIMTDADGNEMRYNPVGKSWAGSAYVTNDRNRENYIFDIQTNGGSGSVLSQLNEPYPNNYQFATPLINFGIVTVNKNFADTFKNT